MTDPVLVAMQRVRNVLRVNTVFSIVAGVGVAASSAWLARQLGGLPTLAVVAIGLGVVAFGIIVLTISEPLKVRAARRAHPIGSGRAAANS